MNRWTPEQSWNWYNTQPWLCGFNYVPSTAVNSTAMWQEETFDPDTIARELSWAQQIGFNCCRVFLPYVVWHANPTGLLQRLDHFLTLAEERDLKTLPILFDDCAFAGKEPYLGPQDDPVPGVHNSGWTPSPGAAMATNPALYFALEEYVTDIVSHGAADRRVLAWDLYNEPGNNGMGTQTLLLLKASFGWARAAAPSQPLTAAIWNSALQAINDVMCALSDILSFHDYNILNSMEDQVRRLQNQKRPILCTEWMRRGYGSHFDTHLPFFKQERIGCFFWGLVKGRTQTHYPWGSKEGAAEPEIWFHDLLHPNGLPYQIEEVELIREQIVGP